MKIIAMVNGGFALPTLRLLKKSRHEIVAIIAMPVRTKHSGEKAGVPPIREATKDFLADVPLFDPEDVNSEEGVALLRSFNADLIFICDYGKILSKEALTTTKYGGLNLHGSLLPRYRGAAPINRAIQAGEHELGVSVIFIEPQVDAGPIVALDSYYPSLEDTAVEIEQQLAKLGALSVLDSINRIESGDYHALPQNPDEASKAPKLRKEEGRINWNLPSSTIINQYRAFQPWPRTYSDWCKSGVGDRGVRLILGPFSRLDENGETFSSYDMNAVPGAVVATSKTAFWIKTLDGALRVLNVQPAGKKNMSAEAFLRGYQLRVGDRLQ